MSAISAELNASLRHEKCWNDVASGLGKVLFGYGVFTLGYFVAIAFFLSGIAPLLNNKPMRIEHMWYFYIGAAVLKVTGLASWALVIAGQFRCLMSSTERNGAKWVIFFCLTCVVMGPVLHSLAWLGGLSTPVRWTGGPQAFMGTKLKFTMMGLYLMVASLLTFGLYLLSFWFYLQKVAAIMEAPRARLFVIFYLVFVVAMAAATYYVFFTGLHPNRIRLLVWWVGGGWLGVWIYWVTMIVVVKVTVEQTMAEVFDPMAAPVDRARYQLASS